MYTRDLYLSDKLIARFRPRTQVLARRATDVQVDGYEFLDIVTSEGNSIAFGLYVHDLIEVMNEFISKNIHDKEKYSAVEAGMGFDARLAKSEEGNIPEMHFDVIFRDEVIETVKLRRYEMRVVVNKLRRLLSHCSVF